MVSTNSSTKNGSKPAAAEDGDVEEVVEANSTSNVVFALRQTVTSQNKKSF